MMDECDDWGDFFKKEFYKLKTMDKWEQKINPTIPNPLPLSQPKKVKLNKIIYTIDMDEVEKKLDKMDVDDLRLFEQNIERIKLKIQEKIIEKI